MYAQCPACLTTFKVTPAQLEARGGMVRCGICSAVFHAEQRLLEVPPRAIPATAEPLEDEAGAVRKTKHGRAGNKSAGRRGKAKAVLNIDDIPVVSELHTPRQRWRPLLWGLGDVLLLVLLAFQFVFFYRDDLARVASWRPAVTMFCRYAGCELRPLQDVTQIELLQTTIAPHPQYDNALRIRATLVNRAVFPQAYPLLEISLTNSAGQAIARRTFLPAQYLETAADSVLTPNVVATALLDVTNPDGKAVGYEIRLITP